MDQRRWSGLAAAAAVAIAAGAASGQTDALFFAIEGVPGSDLSGTWTDAWSVSPDGGFVIGRATGELVPRSGVIEQFLYRWTPSGGVQMLHEADGSFLFDDMKAASHDGSRIVGIEYNPAPEATLSAWRWDESPAGSGMGTKTSVDHLLYYGSEFDGVTGDGSVAVGYFNSGTFQVPTPNRSEALRWSEAGGFQMLPYLDPSHDDARAMDVADDGNIIVGISDGNAVIWDAAAGTVTDMNAGVEGGMAFAVSSNGQHAAGSRTVRMANPGFPDQFLAKGFKWDAVNGIVDLDPFGFSNHVVPTAVSNDGQTVVGVQNSPIYDFPSGDGFIWTPAGGFQYFDDYVQFDINVTNENMSGWSFNAIRDMSPDGSVIVGDAVRPSDGRLVGFVLYVGVQPPPPPTCACETDGAAGVDVFDLLAYLDLWFVNDPGADIDGTAGVDVFDLLSFLDCWFPASAGAPC